MEKGPLIRVKLGEGHYVKMYEADAVAQGLLPGKPKARPQAENKMAPPPEANKAIAPEPEPAEPDDFTEIAGVGKATARLLAANGITTFAQLKRARDLSYLSKAGQAAVEAWRAA